MAITTLDDFKRYCLRALGAPVVNIDITDEQMDDRWEEALEKFNDYHFNGTEKVYIKHQVTQTDIDNRWIPISSNITGVTRVLPINSVSGNFQNPFSIGYQIRAADVWNMTSGGGGQMAYYYNMRQYTSLMEQVLNGVPAIRFNRILNKIHIDIGWGTTVTLGDWIVVEGFQAVTPATYVRVFDEPWLKEYTIALFKRQWGTNMSKFDGVQLIGGITLNGGAIYEEAMQEIQALEQRLRDEFEEPLPFYMG